MITDIFITDDPHTVDKYFDEHFAPDSAAAANYYSQHGHNEGVWFGSGAEMFELRGAVQKEPFTRLTHNKHPQTGKRLTARRKGDARATFDPTLSPPKSVSIMALLMGDKRIIDAHEKAVTVMLLYMELLAATRNRANGAMDDRPTGNLVGARFLHFLSRENDPLLHTHPLIFNATFDPVENRWKAVQPYQFFKQKALLTELYRNTLAAELHKLGYETVATAHGFEVAGVSRKVIEIFSERQKQIDAMAKKAGCNTPAMRNQFAHYSRKAKDPTKTVDEMRPVWLAKLSPEQIAELEAVKAAATAPAVVAPMTAGEALELAGAHLFERLSVVSDTELFTEALAVSRGLVGLDTLRAELAAEALKPDGTQGKRFIVVSSEVTTPALFDAEKRMTGFVADGVGTCPPLAATFDIKAYFAQQREAEKRRALAENRPVKDHDEAEALAAATILLQCCDQVSNLHGPPGAGKSHLINTLRAGIHAAGQNVVVCASSSNAVRNLIKKDRILDAVTLQHLMGDSAMQRNLAGGVVILDEAGMVSVAQMNSLFALSKERGFRVILAGDSRQHHSVEAGDALRLLEKDGKLATAELMTIHRQEHDGYLAAINHLKDGNAKEGFEALDHLGWVREIKTDSRYFEVATDFLAAHKHKDKPTCLVVCSTWREADNATAYIREHLKSGKVLSIAETVVNALHPLQWTKPHMAQPNRYQPGQVVVFNRKNGIFAAGVPLKVTGVQDGYLVVERPGGHTLVFQPKDVADRIAVFEPKPLALAKGERLLLRRNGKDAKGQRLTNGEIVTVKAVRKSGDIWLEDGRTLPATFRHFTHGYALTSQSAQGQTVDRVIVAIDSASAFNTSTTTFYVAASRGKHQCTIYTNNKTDFLFAAMRAKERKGSSELVSEQQAATPQNHEQENASPAGTGAGSPPVQLPAIGISAPSPGLHLPGMCQTPGSGVDPLQRPEPLHPSPGNQTAGFPDQPGVRRLPGAGCSLPDDQVCPSFDEGLSPSLGR